VAILVKYNASQLASLESSFVVNEGSHALSIDLSRPREVELEAEVRKTRVEDVSYGRGLTTITMSNTMPIRTMRVAKATPTTDADRSIWGGGPMADERATEGAEESTPRFDSPLFRIAVNRHTICV
jgi:hypothetical protein